jgi:hypothetical protein
MRSISRLTASGCEGPSPLGCEHECRLRELPAQFAQCPDFFAANRVNARLAILDAPDVQRGRPAELDLRPFQVADFTSPQPVPERDQDQGRVPVTVAPMPSLLDELFDFGRRIRRYEAPHLEGGLELTGFRDVA